MEFITAAQKFKEEGIDEFRKLEGYIYLPDILKAGLKYEAQERLTFTELAEKCYDALKKLIKQDCLFVGP